MKKPKVLATAEFTEDMIETLAKFFDTYEDDGVVSVEVTDHGLWLNNPNGSRQFLGSSRPISSDFLKKLN